MVKANQACRGLTIMKVSVLLQYLVFAGSVLTVAASDVYAADDGVPLTVTGGEVGKAEIRLGEPLEIAVIVKNTSDETVRFSSSKVSLILRKWRSPGTGGTSGTNDIVLTQEPGKGDEVVLEPNEVVKLYCVDEVFPCKTLGALEAWYSLHTMDTAIGRLLPKPDKAQIRLSFEILPTQFMLDVWTGHAAKEKDLQDEMRKLLRLQAQARVHWDRDFVRRHLEYMAGHAFGLLEEALGDPDPVVRSEAIKAYHYSVWAVGNMNAKLNHFSKKGNAPSWARYFEKGDEKAAEQRFMRLAVKGLGDKDRRVRVSCVHVLTYRKAESALDAIRPLAHDEDSDVRSAVLDYLSLFAEKGEVSEIIIGLLIDEDSKVSSRALRALERSPGAPPLSLLKRAFAETRGNNGAGVLRLLSEQEDANLPSALVENFKERSKKERLAILTTIAGHNDAGSLELVQLGLVDEDWKVQRSALMRLLAFPAGIALAIVDKYVMKVSPNLSQCEAIRTELQERKIFPFLGKVASGQVYAFEKAFPSVNGSVPMVSPDGKWVAYLETGFSRPGGSGGMGRSNLGSLVHVVRYDGQDDRILSDMFLVGWLGDSRRIGSARDGFAAICDLEGRVVLEFGDTLEKETREPSHERFQWPGGELRQQFGAQMPHEKRLPVLTEHDYGENAGFSPDGKWFGPLQGKSGAVFLSTEGEQIEMAVPEGFTWKIKGAQATWSPDGRYIALMPGAMIIDFVEQKCHVVPGAGFTGSFGSWEYRKCRWNPWSKDGTHLTFVRGGEIWICDAQGGYAKQLTFDDKSKAMPTFSRDGTQIAYITRQSDNRRHYHRLGPTDIWVVDVGTTLATRITSPSEGRIHCLDWLSGDKILIDRVKSGRSSLRILDVSEASVN